MIDHGNKEISIERQCGLVVLSRAGYYYEPKEESPENLAFIRWIDEKYTDYPFYGVLRMAEWLRRDKKYAVNGQSKACAPADEADGTIRDLSKATVVRAWAGT